MDRWVYLVLSLYIQYIHIILSIERYIECWCYQEPGGREWLSEDCNVLLSSQSMRRVRVEMLKTRKS